MSIIPVYTVRNARGQLLGRYRAKSADAAIRRFLDEQAATAAAFRKSQPMVKFADLTAAIES